MDENLLGDGIDIGTVDARPYVMADGFGMFLEGFDGRETGTLGALMMFDGKQIVAKFDVERAKQIRDHLTLLIATAELAVADQSHG